LSKVLTTVSLYVIYSKYTKALTFFLKKKIADGGGARPLSTKDYPSLDRGLALLDDPQRNGRLLWDVAVAVAALQVQNQERICALREGYVANMLLMCC